MADAVGQRGLRIERYMEALDTRKAELATAEAALRAAGLGQVERVWSDPSGVAVLRLGDGDSAWRLYRHGAILVSGAGVPAGCLNWSRA